MASEGAGRASEAGERASEKAKKASWAAGTDKNISGGTIGHRPLYGLLPKIRIVVYLRNKCDAIFFRKICDFLSFLPSGASVILLVGKTQRRRSNL